MINENLLCTNLLFFSKWCLFFSIPIYVYLCFNLLSLWHELSHITIVTQQPTMLSYNTERNDMLVFCEIQSKELAVFSDISWPNISRHTSFNRIHISLFHSFLFKFLSQLSHFCKNLRHLSNLEFVSYDFMNIQFFLSIIICLSNHIIIHFSQVFT